MTSGTERLTADQRHACREYALEAIEEAERWLAEAEDVLRKGGDKDLVDRLAAKVSRLDRLQASLKDRLKAGERSAEEPARPQELATC